MKNDDLHLDPRVQQARISLARQLFAHQVDYLKVATAMAGGSAAAASSCGHGDEPARAGDHLAELLVARPRYGSRRGHYQPYGLRAAGGR